MKDLLIITQIDKNFDYQKITKLIDFALDNNLSIVIINNSNEKIKKNVFGNIEFFNQEPGISNIELTRKIFNIKLEQGYKYVLNWPITLDFNLEVVENIYHQIKRGFDIVIGYNQNARIQPGFGYKLLFKVLTLSQIKQPYSQLYCFNWFVIQNFIKNERLLIEPANYIFFHVRLHLKILSLPLNCPVPTYVQKHGSIFGIKQTFKLIYYLFLTK